MADTLDATPRVRRRRADAQRSIDAIVSGARTLLNERPDTSMEQIAAAADVTRQTVYAHFPSRDVLIAAVVNAERAEGLAALDAAHLDDLPPVDSLRRFLQISWELVDRCPLLLDPVISRIPDPEGHDPHRPVAALHLERIIRRGQRSGAFDRALPAGWLAAATFALGHAAAEQIAAGKQSVAKTQTMLLASVLRLYGTVGG
jgi:AcrR family transcriptional regulator